MAPYTTILIDDEKIARNRFRKLLDDYPETFEIVAEAGNGDEGLEVIRKLKPDVVFLDIEMPGKTGFELLEELTEFPRIIFCTAYENYALQAFNTLALDYLVKPVEKERLELTVDKLKQTGGAHPELQVKALLELVSKKTETKKLHSIPHKIGDRVILVKPEKICWFSASEKYVEFYTTDGKKYITELSLNKLEERLPDNFERVHRSIIVNTDHIKEFRKYFRGKYILILDDIQNTKIETGRSYSDRIRELLS